YGEVCTIAANGSSLVIPSALVGGQGDEQEEEAEESAVASGSPSPEDTRPQLSPVASGASIENEPPGASAAGVAGGGLHAGPRGDPGVRAESEDNTQRRGRRPGSGSEGADRASGPDAFFLRHRPARTLHERRATRGRIAQRWLPVPPRLPLRFRPSTATILRRYPMRWYSRPTVIVVWLLLPLASFPLCFLLWSLWR
ncbi:surface protease GP63, partial [Trypanosoma cruzi]